jgi:hypothetical protein
VEISEKNNKIDLQDSEISVKEIILGLLFWYRFLLSKWLIVIMAGILGGSAGFLYSYTKNPIYTAELTFVLEGEQSGRSLGGYAGIAGQFGIDLGGGGGGGAFAGDNLFSLMKSRSMIQKALMTAVTINGKIETLAEVYIRINKLREGWIKAESKFANVKFLPGQDPGKFSMDQNTLITAFYNSILASDLEIDKLDKKSSLLSVQVSSTDELFAKYFTEAVTKEVSDFYIESKTKKSVENLAILQHQTDSVKRVFNSDISGVATSSDANPNPNAARQVLRVPSQRKEFDVQVNQVMLSQLLQNLEMAKISLRKETPLIQIIDPPVLPLKVDRVDTKKMVTIGIIISVILATIMLVLAKGVGSYLNSLRDIHTD